jgi:hypothetical protein
MNVLEPTAFWNFLVCILPKSSKQCNILWRVNNTTALAYVKKEGGTCSLQVLVEAEKILVKAHQMSDRILPVFIPTRKNILADAVSRFQEIPDWQLQPFVFRAISARWGLPMINLFASNASKQTQRFYSWDASDNPGGVDALSQRWDFPLAYSFPPIALLKRVVKKLETSKGTFILVSPLWEAQTWLALLLMLKVLEVRCPPFMDDLVTDLTTGKPPQILHNLNLVAWRICGGSLQDLPSNTRDLLKAGWRPFTEDRYDRAWQSFKRHLRSSDVSLDQVGVKQVMNYIAHLHSLKLS